MWGRCPLPSSCRDRAPSIRPATKVATSRSHDGLWLPQVTSTGQPTRTDAARSRSAHPGSSIVAQESRRVAHDLLAHLGRSSCHAPAAERDVLDKASFAPPTRSPSRSCAAAEPIVACTSSSCGRSRDRADAAPISGGSWTVRLQKSSGRRSASAKAVDAPNSVANDVCRRAAQRLDAARRGPPRPGAEAAAPPAVRCGRYPRRSNGAPETARRATAPRRSRRCDRPNRRGPARVPRRCGARPG